MALVEKYKPHTDCVYSVCVTSDNKYVVSASDDRTVQITRLDTGKLVRVIEVHMDIITSVCVTSDNKYVVSGSWDTTIRITRLDTGELVRVIKGHTGRVSSVCVTSDNKYVVSGSWDKTIRITRLDNGQLVKKFQLHRGVLSTYISPNQHNIVAGCKDGSIHVFWTPTYMLKRQWGQLFLWKRQFQLFKDYPGLIRYIGTILLLFC